MDFFNIPVILEGNSTHIGEKIAKKNSAKINKVVSWRTGTWGMAGM
jgi:hypothetical protein